MKEGMEKKILVVVDMQNDFIDGALGSEYANTVVLPNVVEKVKQAKADGECILFTCDTHFKRDYNEFVEGKTIPMHCEFNTHGWQINEKIVKANGASPLLVWKGTFGKVNWGEYIDHLIDNETEIEICGLCTDICVVSNALILRALYPFNKITVLADCCGGTSKEAHDAALTVMKSCLINVV